MKKFLALIVLIIFGVLTYFVINNKENITDIVKNTEEKSFNIDKYTIFGTHLNIEGCIENVLDGDLSLVLKNNKEEITLDSIFTKDNNTCFKTSDKNNTGIYLDDLKEGNFILLIKEENSDTKYYNLNNKTSYNDLNYYTITRNNSNKKININFDKYKEKEYLNIEIKKEKLPKDVYDITIDPGHGGKDIGASYKLDNKVYTESELTLKISLLLKKELENLGLKVKMTRDKDEKLNNYGEDGRAIIPNQVKSKYSISIHINSTLGNMKYGGVEVYTPNDIDYELANLFASNISEIGGYSRKPTDKISDGVYFTKFTNNDIKEARQESIDKGLKPYDIKLGSPYMFMIREVGGINTYAYVDGRNEEHGINKYYNSNQTAEPYLLELGYINYKKDLENLSSKSELFSSAISKSLEDYLKISH